MKPRQYVLGNFFDDFGHRAPAATQVQADMLHARFTQGLQFVDQGQASAAAAETQALHGRLWIGGKVQVQEADIGFVATDLSPESDAAPVFLRSTGVSEPGVHVLADPGRRLLAQPGH